MLECGLVFVYNLGLVLGIKVLSNFFDYVYDFLLLGFQQWGIFFNEVK